MKWSGIVIVVLVMLIGASPAGAQITPTFQNLWYGDHFRHRVDIYIPETGCAPYPVVIFAHGGGWLVGEKTDVAPYLDSLLARGFAVASFNYRFSYHAHFPAQIHDSKAVVRFLRANAAEYGLDADHMAMFGESAGGYLATFVATAWDVPELEGDVGDYPGVSSRIHSAAPFAGSTDLWALGDYHNSPTSSESLLIGYSIPEIIDHADEPEYADWVALLLSANPIAYINSGDPPFYIVHGQVDELVPPSQAQVLYDALVPAGVPATLQLLPGVGHGIPDAEYELAFDFFEQQLMVASDSDGDGTPNCLDGCPNDPLKIAAGACGCGVSDADSDLDGIADCLDGCPNDPLKIEPGDCGCGFEDTDTDGDDTPDCIDGCPDDPLKTNPGTCGCGIEDADADKDTIPDCIDLCPGLPDTLDSDKDGTPDCKDGCPNDPAKLEPGECGCGVAETDSDKDGAPDCNDGCPDDPLKTAPGACGCGVADVDSDKDGAADCVDGCPDDPLKTTPGVCGCGIADLDADRDGTPDCNDGCPNDPLKIAPGACGCGIPDTDADKDGVADCKECPADFAPKGGDGVVDIDDLFAVLDAWGTSNALYDIAPPQGDGLVTIDDLFAVIIAWGPCD